MPPSLLQAFLIIIYVYYKKIYEYNIFSAHLNRNEQVSGSSPLIGSEENASNDARKADFGAFLFLSFLCPKYAQSKAL